MSSYATQALGGWRNEACTIPIIVPGLDLSAVAVRAQIRAQADNPFLLLDMPQVADPAATGIRFVNVTTDATGVKTSHLVFQVSKGAMQSLPFTGEIGDAFTGVYAIQIGGVTRMVGQFAALASPIDSDHAPAQRPLSYGASGLRAALVGGVTLTIGDGGITVTVTGADLISPMVAQAAASSAASALAMARAEAARDQAQGAAIAAAGFVNGIMYPTTAVALAAVPEGGFFTTPGDGSAIVSILFQKVNGAAQQIAAIPAVGMLEVTPEMYGAKGDGVTWDQVAFERLSAVINTAGRGTVRLRRGATYILGRQTPGGANGYLIAGIGLDLHDLDYLQLDYNGAKLKFMDGMKFGSFDPATGKPLQTTLPFYDYSKRADVGYLVLIQRCKRVVTTGAGELDGNSPNAILGGGWGDVGYQLGYYLQFIGECDSVNDDAAVYAHDSLLDLFCYRWDGLTRAMGPKPLRIRNKTGNRAGRNICSITGANGFSVDDSSFRNPGQGFHSQGRITSGPASCLDTEAENAVVCNGRIGKNVALIQGPYGYTAYVADSGDVSDIEVAARCDGSVWLNKPRVNFIGGRLRGSFAKVFGGQANPNDNTRILDSDLADVGEFDSPPVGTVFIDTGGSGGGVVLRGNRATLTRSKLLLTGIPSHGRNVWRMAQDTQFFADSDYVAQLDGYGDHDEFIDAIGSSGIGSPPNGYFMETAGFRSDQCKITPSANFLLKWGSVAQIGAFPAKSNPNGILSLGPIHLERVRVARERGAFGGGLGYADIYRGSGPPPAGSAGFDGQPFNRGDIILSTEIDHGAPRDWGCSVAGTPANPSGTWIAGPVWP